MDKYKTFEELKEELGNKFEEYMYKSNIELLEKLDKAIEYIDDLKQLKEVDYLKSVEMKYIDKLLDILKGEE